MKRGGWVGGTWWPRRVVCARASSRWPPGAHVVRSTWYAAHLGAEHLGADAPEHGLDLGRRSGHLVHVREDDLLGGRRAGVRGRLRGEKGPS